MRPHVLHLVGIGLLATLLAPGLSPAAQATFTGDHVTVEYSGIDEAHAKAMARVSSAARAVAAADFGFDMPEAIEISVTLTPDQKVRLSNDGTSRFILTLASEKELRKPAESGIFHLYGFCHEVGHLAMYRVLLRRDWMTSAAAEGWAHYLGSRLVDAVYARERADLWPDAYDYRPDGMARLKRQLAAPKREDTDAGAGLWMELVEIVGDKGLAPVFKAWSEVEVDPADPGPALAKALAAANPDKRLAAWWKKTEPVFTTKRTKSGFVIKNVLPQALTGRPTELSHDDGAAANKSSLPATGHAVLFEVKGDEWYLTAVVIHGARYGAQKAPDENFRVWICDAEFNAVADFTFPYSVFERDDPKWVRLSVKPTLVPRSFAVCVGFNPTADKGVFISVDKESGGTSLVGLPGKPPRGFGGGDWMIRALVDQPKTAARTKRPN